MSKRTIGLIVTVSVACLLLAGLLWQSWRQPYADDGVADAARLANNASTPFVATSAPIESRLPEQADFALVAESEQLRLLADPQTGHFQVESKSSGVLWRSYPDPAGWEAESSGGVWRSNLLSPLMLEFIDASSSKSQTKLSNWMEERGTLAFERLAGGFRVTFDFPVSGFRVPLEVRLAEEHVEVSILDEGLREGELSLLNLKAYPLFGAAPSDGRDGYLLLPDGPGALARFDANPSQDKSIYRESVYGDDLAFYNEETNRSDAKMPIFGLKSGTQSFVGVLTGGEAYAKLFAAPAGALGVNNWITAEWQYRIKFFQSTDRRGEEGFYTFSKERFTAPSRTVRYYLLEGEAVDYPAMAAKYRQYLIDERGAARLQPQADGIPFYADLIAADLQQGALWDDYIVGTTTAQAQQILSELEQAGIRSVTTIYHGWQRYGYSSYGGLLPADRRIGGDEGLRELAAYARSRGGALWLGANYALNNSRRGGFWNLNDGLRNLSGTLLYDKLPNKDEEVPMVSPRYAVREAEGDLAELAELGIAGVLHSGGIGSGLSTDFNSRNRASREQVLQLQRELLASTRQQLGIAAAEQASFYALPEVTHIHRLADDYSYDLFVDEVVPFAQIALHGLATYTSEWGNLRDDYKSDFLRSVEYGAYPAYVFTAAPSETFRKAYSVWYYSMHYRDWLDTAAAQYARLDEALGGVQDRFIVDHGSLAPGVKRTVYEDGREIIVNYNTATYRGESYEVPPQDFVIREGGGR
ncbi:hypothetical protein PA598K_01209 [Paenibacillus sp. 598K]|uniref:DUF5696 domain-containing protein n=1 Tax=Paenibacillus sp. 598K TaxID=1117987 RepID=UPI000FFA2C1D|nr:DUF5696 domain-containing protein [Paenibacillus sp. 598K]GBF72930.1 hypothetical protein PA598K_01209 [Paenibacillus sp. 598K]